MKLTRSTALGLALPLGALMGCAGDRDMWGGDSPGYAGGAASGSQGDGSAMVLPIREEALRLERNFPDQVRKGEEFTYTLAVTNLSDRPLDDIVIREVLGGANARHVGRTAGAQTRLRPQAGTVQAGAVRQQQGAQQAGARRQQQVQETEWRFGYLRPGETREIEVRAVASEEGTVTTCLTADYQPAVCDAFEVTAPELEVARLLVDAQGNPVTGAIYACDEVFLLYRVTNVGTGETDVVQLREELPEGVVSQGARQIELDIDPLPAGEAAERRVPLDLQGAMTFESSALVLSGDQRVRSPASELRIMQPALDLSLQGPDRAFTDQPVTYQLTVENPSDDPAVETVVNLDLPREVLDRLSVSPAAQREGTRLVVGRLDAGEQRTFRLTFRPEQPGTLQVAAAAEAYCIEDAVRARAATEVVGVAAIRLIVIDAKDPVPAGEITTYQVQVKNQGDQRDLNVQIQAELPSQLEFVDASGDTEVQARGAQLQFGTVPELAPGETARWDVRARATGSGKANFRLQMTSDANPPGVVEEEPTTIGAPQ